MESEYACSGSWGRRLTEDLGVLAFFLNAANNKKDFLEIRSEIISAGINAKHETHSGLFSSRIFDRLMVSNFLFTLLFFFSKRNMKLHKSITS